jgi:GDPmannose 4,6-dehydratase
MKKAIITGVLGQDGSYLAELLASKNYQIFGIIKSGSNINKILWLQNLIPNIKFIKINAINKLEVYKTIEEIKPDEIYNMAGISNVFDPWKNTEEVFYINCKIPLNILDSISKIDKSIKFFQSSSCLIFGRDNSGLQNEKTPNNPLYPYGASKLFADNLVKEYRNNFEMYCCSGIFFNHESPRRQDMFFSKKIIKAAVDISQGKQKRVNLGNLSTYRDYGYAPDFMEAVYLMMNNVKPTDYVIGTGKLTYLEDFVKKTFDFLNLDYRNFIDINPKYFRNNDKNIMKADISKISKELNWKPKHSVDDIIKIIIQDNLGSL